MYSGNNRLFRIIKMLILLESGTSRWTAKQLAEYFNVSERTIHRDKQAMEDMGIPIYFDKQKSTYVIKDTFNFKPPRFTREEAVAITLAGKAFQEKNFPYQHDLELAMSKMLNSLPDSICEVIQNLEDKVSIPGRATVDLSGYEGEMKKINQAIDTTNMIRMDYSSLTSDTTRKVDPYSLIFKNGTSYLVGYCHLREEVRTFRIDRIVDLEILDRQFERPEDFSPQKYLHNVWGIEKGKKEYTVKVLFKGKAARIVSEYNWHTSQEVIQADDEIIFKVRTTSLEEMKRWILSFGSSARVLKPFELRKLVKEEIAEMKKNYTAK